MRDSIVICTLVSFLTITSLQAQQFSTLGNTNLSVGSGSVFLGGASNSIGANVTNAFVGGGLSNAIRSQGNFSVVGGGIRNVDGGMLPGTGDKYGVIGGGLGNVLQAGAQGSVIAGGFFNSIGSNAVRGFIGGGGLNTIGIGSVNAAVVGGFANLASGNASMVFGGFSNIASGTMSTVLAGYFNRAEGAYSVAAGGGAQALHNGTFVWSDGSGGVSSTATNQFLIRASGGVGINTNMTTGNALTVRGRTLVAGDLEVTGSILGNVSNSSAALSAVSASNAFTIQTGGNAGFFVGSVGIETVGDSALSGRNIVAGYQSNNVTAGIVGATIAGGGGLVETDPAFNQVTGSFGTVSGGIGNLSSYYSSVAGGYFNSASGFNAAIGGGQFNNASGELATIPGGGGNTASGEYSFAAGRQAKANHNGAFVWADSREENFSSTGTNQFLIRAGGGVGINTTNPGNNALSVAGSAQIDGTLQIATIQVLTGSGNPTNNAPNGSLYLKAGAAANETLWIRAENAWHPVTP